MNHDGRSTPGLKILLADDEEVIHRGLAPFLADLGHAVDSAYDGETALQMLSATDYDVLIADVQMPKMDGLTLMERIHEGQSDLAIVVITAHGDMGMVIRALRLGAADFLTKPVKLAEIEAVIEKALRVRAFQRSERRRRETIGDVQSSMYHWRTGQRLIGVSPAMASVRKLIQSAVEADCKTVLIQGETGVGKEVVAREIHLLGKKEGSPFIAVSCPALPETLVEAELFGHVRGTFTGAQNDKAGCFETAEGGTLFLDEIADLSEGAQAKLLRVLETRCVRRIGGKHEIDVDVNVIAATNSPLAALARSKKFREDLFYRLNGFTINIPPLRERKDDIIPLAKHFLESYVQSKRINVTGFSPEAQALLANYELPGNARELRNIIERAVIIRRDGLIEPRHLNLNQLVDSPVSSARPDDEEKNAVLLALEKTKWNRARAAKELGISYASLRYRMKKHDIEL
jgi:two-component system, NtrC family, response regulator AtoC